MQQHNPRKRGKEDDDLDGLVEFYNTGTFGPPVGWASQELAISDRGLGWDRHSSCSFDATRLLASHLTLGIKGAFEDVTTAW